MLAKRLSKAELVVCLLYVAIQSQFYAQVADESVHFGAQHIAEQK